MKRKFIFASAILLLGVCIFCSSIPVAAQAGNAYDMINGINELRASNGQAPFSINAALMASAQAHADWITETGQGGHIGSGGSYAVDRAIAAGYGGGATVFVTENWARGFNLSVIDCIYVSWNDADHMGNMLGTWHNEIGAGVSISSNNQVTYVVNFGHISGSAPLPQPPSETVIIATQAQYNPPLQTTTPKPDGSIFHVIKEGQFLIHIANAYEIALDELLNLNNLTIDSPIYPGDTLIIQIGTTPEATPTPNPTLSFTPSPTLKPSNTPRPSLTPFFTPTLTPKPEKNPGYLSRIFTGNTKYLGIGLIAVSVLGLVLLIISSSRMRK